VRLVQDLRTYAQDAGVQAHWLWSRFEDHCGDTEGEYVLQFKRHSHTHIAGIVYEGKKPEVVRKCAITGKLMRNCPTICSPSSKFTGRRRSSE
jgi:hypothetical protein